MNLVEETKDFIEKTHYSQSKCAKMFGVSQSTFSMWLKGTYRSPETINAKIMEFFEKKRKREEAQNHGLANFADTCMSLEIIDTLDYFRTQKCIGCIFGDAGIGKTKTISEWSKYKTDVIVITARPAFSGSKAFSKLLARQLKSKITGACDDIYTDIINKLKGTDKMLIIDEAQHLKLSTIEDIRSLNDDPETRTTIVFVGNLLVYKKLKGSQEAEFAQLFSRTIITNNKLLTERFELEDIKKVFNVEDDEANEVLLNISKTKYGLRGAVNVYENALNNNDISKKGLLTMARINGIII